MMVDTMSNAPTVDPDPGGYEFPQPLMAQKHAIEDYAERVLKVLELKPGFDIYELVHRLGGGIEPMQSPDWGDSAHGAIRVEAPNKFTIYVSRFTSIPRDRFTIAHELGHYLLHSNQGEKKIEVNRSGSNRLEWEANWFAAALLMPEEPFMEMWKEVSESHDLDEAEQTMLRRASTEFGVSYSAVQVRMKALKIVRR